ncbi:Ldl recept a domain containing protein, partial [Asbolus verrucosus]
CCHAYFQNLYRLQYTFLARKCSRYQFECRSTSECIAIYNACDGIPQCADGSDEAPELGCPDSLTTSVPVAAHPAPPARYESNIPPPRLHPLPPALPQSELYRPQESLGPSQMQAGPQQDPDFLRPVPNSRNNLNSRVQFDSPQMPQYAPASIPMQSNNWVPHQTHEIQPQMPQYADKNSHIFNHKENGLQVPDGQEIRYNKYKGAMQYLHRALGYSSAG